jgi:hypothetical protein
MNYRKLFNAMAIAIAAGCGTQASAAVINLTLETPASTAYQQTENRPCIIGESSCKGPLQTATFPNGQQSVYDVTTMAYTVDTIRALVGNVFFVGIDVNTTTHPLATEFLDLFTASVGGDVFTYNPASPGTDLFTGANGTGYSDALLKGFDLSKYAGTDTITFHTIINTPTDGKEQFFLITAGDDGGVPPSSVPEPGTAAILGLGLLGLGYTSLRRKNKQA